MNSKIDNLEFEVLGHKVSMRPDEGDGPIRPQEVVDYVRKEANQILERLPHLDKGQIAVLLALKITKDYLCLEREYRDEINHLHEKAGSILQYIEEVSPTTI